MSLSAEIGVTVGGFELDADLEVADGELLAVLGPNGSGKTTLLRALAGLVPLDEGHIVVDGALLDDPGAGVFVPPEQRPIGVVFQQYLLFEHLSARDNVAFGLRARGVKKGPAPGRGCAALGVGRAGRPRRRPARPAVRRPGTAGRPRSRPRERPAPAPARRTARCARRPRRAARFVETCGINSEVSAASGSSRRTIRSTPTPSPTVSPSSTADRSCSRAPWPRSWLTRDLGTSPNSSAPTSSKADSTARCSSPVTASRSPSSPTSTGRRSRSSGRSRSRSPASLPTPAARNTFDGVVDDVDRIGDRVRVGIAGPLHLTAEITVGALDSLGLRPGDAVSASLKATDIEIYPA